jgi:hypothetical protein
MVSLDAYPTLAGSLEEADEPKLRRVRHDWVRGEVRCLMCARLVGRLLGTEQRRQSTDRSTWHSASFFAYRPADATLPVVAFRPGMRLRCADCGGAGALDDVDYFSTYDEVPASAMDEDPLRRGPGRPRRSSFIQPRNPGATTASLRRQDCRS